MKVLFVNPPQTASKYKFMGVIAPPLGIAYMAGVLQENNVDVEILDASAEDMDFKDVENELLKRKPDLVALTALTPTIGRALETAQVVKETLPDSIVVIGGYHPTFNFIETLEDENIDIVIRGEGEYIMLNLVQALENQSSLHDVEGIVFEDKYSKEIVVTPEAPLIEDLDKLPFPALNLLPMDKYRLLDMDTHMTTMITTRGCPMRVLFAHQLQCMEEKFGKEVWKTLLMK